MRIAFDIDETLIIPSLALVGEYYERISPYDVPNYENIALYKLFQEQGCEMILWSDGGVDYAKMWGDKLGLMPFTVLPKEKNDSVDICFDDCDVDLAKVNIKLKRINYRLVFYIAKLFFQNRISRAEWNKNKTGG